VTEEQRYALIDYISHLVNRDYANVARDLVKLGFVPPDLEDPAKTAAVVPQLTNVLGQLVQGGGARKINVQQVGSFSLSILSTIYFVFVVT
jgi:aarF domain-containing kinase